MTRMTIALRDKIVRNAITKAGIDKEQAEHDALRAQWENEAWIHACGGPEVVQELEAIRQLELALAARIPGSFGTGLNLVNRSRYMYINVAGCKVKLERENTFFYSHNPEPILAANYLAQRFHDLETDKRDLDAKRKALRAQIRGALEPFNTVKQLLEAWPEAAELLPPAEQPQPKAQLPAVPVADLNALLGLPSGSK